LEISTQPVTDSTMSRKKGVKSTAG
jgi:hypothetical protein